MEGNIMGYIRNLNGKEIDFNTATQLMNDEIREGLHTLDIDNEQDFFTAYEKAHAEKFGEWELSKENPVW
jgi:hypothetical protein